MRRTFVTATVPIDLLQYVEALCLLSEQADKRKTSEFFAYFNNGVFIQEYCVDYNQNNTRSPATDSKFAKLEGKGTREGIGLLATDG